MRTLFVGTFLAAVFAMSVSILPDLLRFVLEGNTLGIVVLTGMLAVPTILCVFLSEVVLDEYS